MLWHYILIILACVLLAVVIGLALIAIGLVGYAVMFMFDAYHQGWKDRRDQDETAG